MKLFRNVIEEVGTAAALGSILLCSTVFAQDDTGTLEEITVVGFRDSLEQATNIKRDSDSLVDAITALDVNKFPDENVADSLQRITGVQITRLRGEGQRANIRGLPDTFVGVNLNGVPIPNALRSVFLNVEQSTRAFDFTILPSEFIRTLEVNKSGLATLPTGGLAGTIDVQTPRPFDFDERVLSFSAQISNESNSPDNEPKFTAFYSDKFADDRFGVALGLTSSTRAIVTEGVRNIGFFGTTENRGFNNPQEIGAFFGDGLDAAANAANCTGTFNPDCFGQDFNGNGVLDDESFLIPNVSIYDFLDETRERNSALLSLQFQATDNFQLYFDGVYSELDIDNAQLEGLFLQPNSVGPFLPGRSSFQTFGANQNVVTQFSGRNIDYRNNNRIERRDGDLYVASLGGLWESGDWTIDAKVTASESEQTGDALSLVNVTYVDVTQDFQSDGFPRTTFLNDESLARITTNPNASRFVNVNGAFGQLAQRDLVDFQLDFSREMDGFVTRLNFGLQYIDQSLFLNGNPALSGGSFGADDIVTLLGPQAPSAFLESLGFTNTQSAENFLLTTDFDGGAFLDGSFPANRLYADTGILFRSFTTADLLALGTINPGLNAAQDIEEEILDFYISADFSADSGRLTGNVGLRLSDTSSTSTGVGTDLSVPVVLTLGLTTEVVTLDNFAADGGYTELLPSLNLRYEVTDNLVARAAASRTLARPDLSAVSPSISVDAVQNQIAGGNPELDPFIADNFDFGLEYYWGSSNLLSLTYFNKDIVSLLRAGTDQVVLDVNNQATGETIAEIFTDTSVTNGVGANVYGFEFGYQQTFENIALGFFSNMGISANYTFVEASDEESLPGSSKDNYNLNVFYEDDIVSARLAYTYRDDFQTQIGASLPGVNTIETAFGTLDFNVQVRLGENFTVFTEGNNLLDEAVVRNLTIGTPREITESGTRLSLGVRASF